MTLNCCRVVMKVPPAGRRPEPFLYSRPRRREYENDYQDRSQNTAGAITPVLADAGHLGKAPTSKIMIMMSKISPIFISLAGTSGVQSRYG